MTRAAWRRVKAGATLLGFVALAACNRSERADDAPPAMAADTAPAGPVGTPEDAEDGVPDESVPSPAGSDRPGTSGGGVSSRPTGAAERDTARGIVRRVGNEPGDVLVLERSPRDMLALTGPGITLLRAVEGLEVAVTGRLTTARLTAAAPRPISGFDVAEFSVRAMDGREAHDGTLVSRGGSYYLKMASGGELPVPSPPDALLEHVGARVWIAGPRGEPPRAFGVIRH